jgi:hypothetical protein
VRNIHDVIAEKEAELQLLTQQLDALKLVLRLLIEDSPQRTKATVGDALPASSASMSAPRGKVFP